jgi:hypothetical protein
LAKQEAGANPKSKAEEQIALLTDKISHLVKEAERLGFEGNIEQAQGLLKLSDQFKSEREALKKGEGLSFVSEHILFFVLISVFSCFFFNFCFLGNRTDARKTNGSLQSLWCFFNCW